MTLAADMMILEAAEHPRPKLCGSGVTFHGEEQLRQLGGIQVEVPAFAVHRLGRLRLMLWQLAAIAPFKMQRNIGVFLGLLPPSRQPPTLTARRPTAEKLTLK